MVKKINKDVKIVPFVNFDLGGFLTIIKTIIVVQNISKINQPVINA